MTCKFVLKCIITEKLLVDNNDLVKAVAKTFLIKIFVFSLNTLYIYMYIYINIYIYIYRYIHTQTHIYTYMYIEYIQ